MPWSKEMLDVRYLNLINLASQLKAGKGLTMVVSFVRGDSSSLADCERAQEVSRARAEELLITFTFWLSRVCCFTRSTMSCDNRVPG